MTKTVLGSATLVLVSVAIWVAWSIKQCPLDDPRNIALAVAMVREELSSQGLDLANLWGPRRDMECGVSFAYSGGGRKIDYVVTDDILHGPELHRWDYAENANGP